MHETLGVNCSLGIEDRNLASLASTPTNSCRQLHRFVARTGKRLPVKISYVKTFIKKITKSRVHEVEVDFPTLPLSAWMEASFGLGGHFFLGGKGLTTSSLFQRSYMTGGYPTEKSTQLCHSSKILMSRIMDAASQ